MEELFPLESMGETGENVAERYGISREDQDAFALRSQHRWAEAQAAGRFADELVDVAGVETDEHPRPDTSAEELAKLRPAFRAGRHVTAGNSSGINDGAAAVVIASEERARALGAEPFCASRRSAVAGVDPRVMGIGPIPAVRKLLARTGVKPSDLDLVELNEAFASQSLAVVRELGLDEERVNVNGGAIAIGHPLGMSGARLVVSLAPRAAPPRRPLRARHAVRRGRPGPGRALRAGGMSSAHTQVAIMGAGPAGLVLARFCTGKGSSPSCSRRAAASTSRAHARGRARAGHRRAADQLGRGRADGAQGLVHHGIELQFEGERHRIDLSELTGGRSIVVYGQTEVVKDLIAARLESGRRCCSRSRTSACTTSRASIRGALPHEGRDD